MVTCIAIAIIVIFVFRFRTNWLECWSYAAVATCAWIQVAPQNITRVWHCTKFKYWKLRIGNLRLRKLWKRRLLGSGGDDVVRGTSGDFDNGLRGCGIGFKHTLPFGAAV